LETLGRLGWRTSLYNVSLAQDVPSLWRFRALGASFGGGGGFGGVGDSFRGLAGGLYAHDHLLAAQEGVANELARAQSHLRVRHDDGGCRGSRSSSSGVFVAFKRRRVLCVRGTNF